MTLGNYIICLTVLCFHAAAAQADCVSSDDLSKGIIVTYDSGDVEAHRQEVDDKVAILSQEAGGRIATQVLARGVYLIRSTIWDRGRPSGQHDYTFDFDVPPSGIPLPRQGEIWETRGVLNSSSIGQISQELAFTYGNPGTLEIGGCSYGVIPVERTITNNGQPGSMGMLFLFDVGISFLVEFDGKPERKPVSLVAVGR